MKDFKFKKLGINAVQEVFPLLNDLDIKPYLPGLYCKDLEDAQEVLKNFNSFGNELFKISSTSSNATIGLLAYEHIDARSAELSFLISKEFRNNHYSAQSLKEFLLELPHLHPSIRNIYFFIDEKNLKSKKVVESIGAKYSHTFEDDEIVYKKTILESLSDEQVL